MRLEAIRMRYVRKFGREGMAIENIPPGLSMLAAPNEFGKSTLFDALRAVLFQKHSANNAITKGLVAVEGSAPEIEVDFVTGGERYRLSKRFIKRQSAELTDLGTGRVLKADGEAHDWMTGVIGASKAGEGPTGLLWVEQGGSMRAPEAGEAGKSLLANLLEHEVGDVTGGERARNLLKRVQEELGELVTQQGKPKTGPYKSLVSEVAAVDAALTDTQERLAASEHLLAELSQLSQSIRSLSDPELLDRLEADLVTARQTLIDAREAEKILDTLRNSLGDKSAALLRCQQDLGHFDGEVDQAAELQSNLAKHDKLHTEYLDASEKLQAAVGEAREQEAFADKARQDAEKVAILCAQVEKQLVAQEQSQKLKKTLADATAISEQNAVLIGKKNQNSLTESVLDEIRTAKLEVDRQQARLDAARPTLTPQLTTKGQDSVRLEGTAIQGVVHLSGRQTLSLGDLGEMVLNAVDPADARASFDKATQNLSALFAKHGITAIRQAEERAAERRDIDRKIEQDQYRLHQLAPDGLAALKEAYETACAVLSGDSISQTEIDQLPDRSTADRDWANAREGYDKCRDRREKAEADYAAAISSVAEAKSSRERYAEQLETLYARIGSQESWTEKRAKLKSALEAAQQSESELKTQIASREKAFPPLEAAEADVKRLETAKSTNTKSLSDKKIREAEIKRDLAAISEKGLGEELANLEQRRASLQRQLAGFESQVAALQLLEIELKNAQKSLQEAFLRPVSSELRPLLAMVLPDAEISLGEDFNAQEIARAGRTEEIDILSGGTQEQVAVLTRLAFAQLMAKRGREMPVILDDALVWCDDSRLENVFRALHAAARDIQCIVLTCHERGFSTLGAPHLAVTNWPDTE